MRPLLPVVLALVLLVPATPWPAPAAEDKLVVYTAYEENELKTFWEQFKKDLPDLAGKASYIRGSTGPTMARVEAEKANPQADVIWGVFNDYLTGAATKGLLEPYAAQESQAIPARFKHPENMWQGAPIDVIYPADGIAWTFEGNALVKGAKNPQNAKRFLDWAVSKAAMTSYAAWRGAALTRTDVSVSGPKISEMNLIAIDFVKAGDPAYKDRLVKRWLEKFSR